MPPIYATVIAGYPVHARERMAEQPPLRRVALSFVVAERGTRPLTRTSITT